MEPDNNNGAGRSVSRGRGGSRGRDNSRLRGNSRRPGRFFRRTRGDYRGRNAYRYNSDYEGHWSRQRDGNSRSGGYYSRNSRSARTNNDNRTENGQEDLLAIIRDMGNTIAALEERLDCINNRISADATAPAIRTTSNNDDFPEICKCIYRWVQISHHQFNWKQLPKSIDERLKRLADDINPPMADEEFRSSVTAETLQFGDKLQQLVIRHLDKKLVETEVKAGSLNPTDVTRAREVATKYINTRLGRRLQPSRRMDLIDRAVDMIGINRRPTSPGNRNPEEIIIDSSPRDQQQQQRDSVTMSTRKRTAMTTPEALSVHNRFDAPSNVHHTAPNSPSATGVGDTRTTASQPVPPPKKMKLSMQHMLTESGVDVYLGAKHTWKIDPAVDTECIVIGDSNLRNITRIPPHWEVHSLSGARITHVTRVIDLLQAHRFQQLDVVIQAGINHREIINYVTEEEIKDLVEAMQASDAINRIFFAGVSIPTTLDHEEIRNLRGFNKLTSETVHSKNYIAPLDDKDVHINSNDRSGIHYTPETADRILSNIYRAVTGRDF
jgi:hypothetical protein